MIARCPCSAVATHMVTIELVPVAAPVPARREPGQDSGTRYGYYSAGHIPTLAQMQREYRRVGLDVASYDITELWTSLSVRLPALIRLPELHKLPGHGKLFL
jgi:hypothetical protein